jgi:hypothetical protein
MKTINSNGTILRVSDEVADQEVKFGRAKFVPKSEWKALRVPKETRSEEEISKHQETVSEKALRRSKLKSKQRELDPLDNLLK